MRSSELATLAGVTVRALRHYHQLGILDEPPRSVNGYREYDVHHLVRILRISRLASLGLPLQGLAEILDAPGDDASAMLDELDREVAAQIERLEARRATIAELRRWNAAPDLPSELAPYAALLAASASTSEIARFDREQTILLSHLAGPGGAKAITALYARFTDPSIADASKAFTERFAALQPDASDDEIAALVEELVTSFGPLVRDLRLEIADLDLTKATALLTDHADDMLNAAQQQALILIEQGLTAYGHDEG
ncbi:MerR family transcriptional regulator [Microcella sp.]|uniref:MerR family transcriptional regulator n=1 Tax=Microcella sp. TaxID=1913979 RepID=UPI0025605257|nr:MerR family transcriptional regulator [Microcella sp.]MBX9471586.1 MerR family transcriptional regulator [Microcella sp.]